MNEIKSSSVDDDAYSRYVSTFTPELYAEHKDFRHSANLVTLQMFQPSFSRAPYAHQQFLDLGCGIGDFTLQQLLPRCQPCRRIVAVDPSQKLIQYAQQNFAHPQITFDVLNIRDDVSDFGAKYGKFDRVYSFYVLNRAKDHYKAYKNISDLMTDQGECLLIYEGRLPGFNIWRRTVKMDRWKLYAELMESFIPQTHDVDDLISHMLDVLKSAHLKPRTCEVLRVVRGPEKLDEIIKLNLAMVPLLSLIPDEDKETFKEDFVKEIRKYWKENTAEGREICSELCLVHAVKY